MQNDGLCPFLIAYNTKAGEVLISLADCYTKF